MTSVATDERPPRAATGARAADRLLAALPLLSAYLIVCTFFAWHAVSHVGPWLFSDEIEYTQLSRAIAETGEAARRGEARGFTSLYTFVLAPVWWIDDARDAYATAKYLGVLVMAGAIFPVYGLARLLVPRGWALFAAVGSVTIPAIAYSRLLITEPLAYFWSALCLWLAARALASWSWRWLAPAAGALLLAPAVRDQLLLLPAVVAVAVPIALFLGPRARAFRRGWRWPEWTAVALLVAGSVVQAHELGPRFSSRYYLATTLPDRFANFAIWPAGALVIGVGLVPAVAALTALWRPRDLDLPGYRAWVALLVPAIPAFTLYTTLKATYLSTVFGNVVAERNMIYLAPLLFVGTALFLHRPAANPAVLAGATALVAYLVTTTPYQLEYYPYGDAPGLAVLAEANRTLALGDAAIRNGLVWILAGFMVAAGLGALRPRSPAVRGGGALVGALVVAWMLVGANSFGDGINGLSARVRSTVPEPPDWIDRQTGGRPTMYLGQAIADPNAVLETEFWNRSVVAVGSLDGTAPPPGPTPVPVPGDTRGTVLGAPPVEYVVTDSTGVDVVGEVVERTGLWRLIRIDKPLRFRTSVNGVYPDGWTSARASYTHFEGTEPGMVDVVLSRKGWGGPDVPGRVTVDVGPVGVPSAETIANPCRDGVCASTQPFIRSIEERRTWTAHSGGDTLLRIPATPPFRVEIRVDPTFSPFDYGIGDNRQLGVQVAFGFRAGPSG